LLVGTPINEVSSRLEFDIKPIIKKQINQYEAVYNIFYDAFNDFVTNNSNIHVSGKTKIFEQPEYNTIEELKRLSNKFEDMSLIEKVNAKDTDDDDIKIYIGEDNEFDPNVTIIRKKYQKDGKEGTVAIIGPKRMDYQRIVSMLEYVDKNLDNRKDKDGKKDW